MSIYIYIYLYIYIYIYVCMYVYIYIYSIFNGELLRVSQPSNGHLFSVSDYVSMNRVRFLTVPFGLSTEDPVRVGTWRSMRANWRRITCNSVWLAFWLIRSTRHRCTDHRDHMTSRAGASLAGCSRTRGFTDHSSGLKHGNVGITKP